MVLISARDLKYSIW